jgi:hypothetical protein
MIDSAIHAINSAKAESRMDGVQEAEVKLANAQEQYELGDYVNAYTSANLAYQNALSAKPSGLNPLLLAGLIILIGAGIFVFFQRDRLMKLDIRKTEKAPPLSTTVQIDVDLNAIWEAYPHLRFDDKEIIRFLNEQNGEAFASEIRERFEMPRSSTWRMIRRLMNEGIVEEIKIGNQSLVRIQKKFLISK